MNKALPIQRHKCAVCGAEAEHALVVPRSWFNEHREELKKEHFHLVVSDLINFPLDK